MLFNSFEFAIFLPLVFLLYWFVFNKNTTIRNVFLIVVSYIFYGWWSWKFLLLIAFSSSVDFLIGRKLNQTGNQQKRNILLGLSLLVNLGLLGIFKYYGFFVDNFVEAFRLFGKELNIATLNLVLPVGISFYTFQTLGYTSYNK